MTTIEAMRQAQHLLRWTHFGECRTYPGPVPEAQEVDKLLTKAIAAVEAQGVEPKEDFCYCGKDVSLQMVSGGGAPEGYLGKVVLKIDGKYHDYIARPTQPTADHIGDTTKLAGERAALIAQLSNDDADMLRRKWFGHRNTGHLSFVEAVDATMEGLMAQQVAVPQGWKLVPESPTLEMMSQMPASCNSGEWCEYYSAMLAATPKPPQADALAADHAEDVRAMVPMTEKELDDLLPTNDSMSRKDSQRWIARATERHHKIGVKQ